MRQYVDIHAFVPPDAIAEPRRVHRRDLCARQRRRLENHVLQLDWLALRRALDQLRERRAHVHINGQVVVWDGALRIGDLLGVRRRARRELRLAQRGRGFAGRFRAALFGRRCLRKIRRYDEASRVGTRERLQRYALLRGEPLGERRRGDALHARGERVRHLRSLSRCRRRRVLHWRSCRLCRLSLALGRFVFLVVWRRRCGLFSGRRRGLAVRVARARVAGARV
mmetsp:Transcript_13030/g.35071  ORF Transcript_13030/g.35071 Transcript_13030/m.35071 type:complete len:225 (+) Transcript_13030:753-1427(+)